MGDPAAARWRRAAARRPWLEAGDAGRPARGGSRRRSTPTWPSPGSPPSAVGLAGARPRRWAGAAGRRRARARRAAGRSAWRSAAAAAAVLVGGARRRRLDRARRRSPRVFSVSPAGVGTRHPGGGPRQPARQALRPTRPSASGRAPISAIAPANAFHAGELAAVASIVVVVLGVVVALRRREAGARRRPRRLALAIFWLSDRTQSPYVAAKALALAAPLVMAARAREPGRRSAAAGRAAPLARVALVGVFALGAAYSRSLAAACRAPPRVRRSRRASWTALAPDCSGPSRRSSSAPTTTSGRGCRGARTSAARTIAAAADAGRRCRSARREADRSPARRYDFDSIGEADPRQASPT